MTARAPEDRRHRQDQARDDLVRIVTKLTRDVEHFDSIVVRQRRLLEHLAGPGIDLDTSQLQLDSERISLEAAALVACARQALERLSLLAEPGATLPPPDRSRVRLRRLPKDERLD